MSGDDEYEVNMIGSFGKPAEALKAQAFIDEEGRFAWKTCRNQSKLPKICRDHCSPWRLICSSGMYMVPPLKLLSSAK